MDVIDETGPRPWKEEKCLSVFLWGLIAYVSLERCVLEDNVVRTDSKASGVDDKPSHIHIMEPWRISNRAEFTTSISSDASKKTEVSLDRAV